MIFRPACIDWLRNVDLHESFAEALANCHSRSKLFNSVMSYGLMVQKISIKDKIIINITVPS